MYVCIQQNVRYLETHELYIYFFQFGEFLTKFKGRNFDSVQWYLQCEAVVKVKVTVVWDTTPCSLVKKTMGLLSS